MSSLTEISIYTKKIITFVIGFLIFIILLRGVISLLIKNWQASHPVPIPGPNVRFDKLPAPQFPFRLSSSGMHFTLENIEGKPPETTSAGKVYPIPKTVPSFLSDDKAQKFAMKLEFTLSPDDINSTYYHYADPVDNNRTLTLDIASMNFKLKYDYSKNPSMVFNQETIFSKEKTIAEVKNYIRRSSLFDDAILNGNITTNLYKFDPIQNKLISSVSQSETQAVRVNFNRNDLDKMKIVSPVFGESYNYALYTFSSQIKSPVIELSYANWPIDYNNFATYPLRSGQQAWKDLVDGYALVSRLGNNKKLDTIIIRKIYLAYYDSEEPQPFLQPIFVFEGDNDFAAYLPAISPVWLE